MDNIFILGILILGPFFYMLLYAHELFGLPKYAPLIYMLALVVSLVFWNSMALIILLLSWLLVIGSWVYVVIGIFRYK